MASNGTTDMESIAIEENSPLIKNNNNTPTNNNNNNGNIGNNILEKNKVSFHGTFLNLLKSSFAEIDTSTKSPRLTTSGENVIEDIVGAGLRITMLEENTTFSQISLISMSTVFSPKLSPSAIILDVQISS